MDFLELAKERYSVRRMSPEKVKQEDLNKILEEDKFLLKNVDGKVIQEYKY